MLQRAASAASSALRFLDASTQRLLGSPVPRPLEANPFAGLLPWELTSKAALSCSDHTKDGSLDEEYAKLLMDFAGVVVIPKAVDGVVAAACNAAADALTEGVRTLVASRGVDPDGAEGFSFRGAHQRDPGRLDIRNHFAMDEAPFDHPSLCAEALWLPIVRGVLGGDAVLLWKGVVVTDPGCEDQAYHPDGPPLSREAWEAASGEAPPPGPTLPPHCLTVFVPLVPLTAANGPTAFLPGTHHASAAATLEAEAQHAGENAGARGN